MPIHERILNHERPGALQDARWFAVRQPAIVRFLGERLQGDGFALGLFACARIALVFQEHTGRPCARLSADSLAWAEERVHDRDHPARAGDRDLEAHSPALVAWIARFLEDPTVPLCPNERREVGVALLSVARAFTRACSA